MNRRNDLIADIDTVCVHENNRCKRKKSCLRYGKQFSGWESVYYELYGQECEYYVPKT